METPTYFLTAPDLWFMELFGSAGEPVPLRFFTSFCLLPMTSARSPHLWLELTLLEHILSETGIA